MNDVEIRGKCSMCHKDRIIQEGICYVCYIMGEEEAEE